MSRQSNDIHHNVMVVHGEGQQQQHQNFYGQQHVQHVQHQPMRRKINNLQQQPRSQQHNTANPAAHHNQQQVVVDFTLASTYLPGIICLLRTSVVIIIMSREWATHSLPTLILLGIFLYVDRVIRAEAIFDSSALTCTVFVAHMLNLCRSKIAHIDEQLAIATTTTLPAMDTANMTTILSSPPHPSAAAAAVVWWWWQQQAFFAAYCAVSVLLLLDMDVSAMFLSIFYSPNHLAKNSSSLSVCFQIPASSPALPPTVSPQKHVLLRVSTVVMHCLFVGALLQIPVEKADFMLPWKVVARSFTFVVLAICWTYSVGIHEMSVHVRSYPYFYNPVLQGKLVQPFTPCQLRFLVVLFLDRWFLLATSLAMIGIVTRQVSVLVAQVAAANSFSNNDSSLADMAAASSCSVEDSREMMMMAMMDQENDDAAEDDDAVEQQQQQHHHHHVINVMHDHHTHHHLLPTMPTTMAAQPTMMTTMKAAVTTMHDDARYYDSSSSSVVGEDETLAMFKMARKAASMRLGEQI